MIHQVRSYCFVYHQKYFLHVNLTYMNFFVDTLFFYFLQTHVFFKSACCQNQIVNLILCAVVLGIAGIVFNIVTTNNQQGGR